MRIITGKYKGAALFTVPGNTTRPTTDYQREVVFSIFQEYAGARALDLYAGTGSFGLECLSRGAAWTDFVEFSNKALTILIKNIAKLKCGDACHVHRRKVSAFLSVANPISEQSSESEQQSPDSVPKHTFLPWDVIFLDPPYNHNLVNETLRLIYERNLLAPDGVIIVEHSPKEKIDEAFQPYIIRQKPTRITSITVLQSR